MAHELHVKLLPCLEAFGPPHVPSFLRLCRRCRSMVWVAEDMLPHIGDLLPTCLLCTRLLADQNEDMTLHVHEAQEDMLDRLGILGQVRRDVLRVNNRRITVAQLMAERMGP